MIEIPKQLQKSEFNFCLVNKWDAKDKYGKSIGKAPFESEWQKKGYKFNDPKLLQHIKAGGNYGVIGGGEKNLIIVDFDNAKIQEELIKILPKTFTVKTGSGLLHKYFFSTNDESFKIFDEKLNTLADIQGKGKQVIGGNSRHPNGNKYEVIDNSNINFIEYAELRALIMPYDKKPKKIKPVYNNKDTSSDDIIELVKSKINLTEVLEDWGVNTNKNPTNCPLHSSKGGKCLGFDAETAHCFHCENSWNLFQVVMEHKNYNFKEALEYLVSKAGLEEEYKKSKEEWAKKQNNLNPEKIFTESGQVKKYIEQKPIFYDKAGLWWMWNINETFWERVDEVDILNMIEESSGRDVITPRKRTLILNSLKQEGRKNIPKNIKPTWIQFKNTIVDIKTGERFLANPKYFVTNPIPFELSIYENTPTMDRIFEEWVGKDYIKTLYEIIAYCLLSDYPIHRIFCLIGEGMNGKSKFLELLRKFVGTRNVCSTELDTLLTSRFEITRLHKKLVCQMGETNFNEMNKTSILKKLSGGDLIGYEYKRADLFEEINYAKILISTNNLPTTSDKTIGFYRRWCIIDFPNRFSEKKDILEDIPLEEYNSLALKCLIILKDLLIKREFNKEGSIEERMKKYEDKSDPLEKFMKEFTTDSLDKYIWKNEFEKKLNDWCKENRFRTMSSVAIGKKMKEKGIEQGQKYEEWMSEFGKKGGRAWLGISWIYSEKKDEKVAPFV